MSEQTMLLLTGPRTCGLTAAAIKIARDRKIPFGLLAPTDKEAEALSGIWEHVPAMSVRYGMRPPIEWMTYIFIDANSISSRDFLRASGYAQDRGASIIVCGRPPIGKDHWLLRFRSTTGVEVREIG